MGAPEGSSNRFRTEDFQLNASPPSVDKSTRAARDLFQPKVVVVARPKVQTPPPPPPKTPEQLEEEAARAELTQIKLVGVVFRGDKGQAFLVKGDQTYMVSVGEKVGDRFTVDAVTADSVQLKDPRTSVSGQIPVSGK
jgi:Tfp pilus assembly protein PilP